MTQKKKKSPPAAERKKTKAAAPTTTVEEESHEDEQPNGNAAAVAATTTRRQSPTTPPHEQPIAHLKNHLPDWHYQGVKPVDHPHLPNETVFSPPALDGPDALHLGHYSRQVVSNCRVGDVGRAYFDLGLRLMFSYQHEIAIKCFLACLLHCPNCALAHGFIALCHSPNYNFKGRPYYESTYRVEDISQHDLLCIFPSQQVADRHSKAGVELVEEIRRLHKKKFKAKKSNRNNKSTESARTNGAEGGDGVDNPPPLPDLITDVESQLLSAIRVLTCCPGVDPDLADETVGRPYATAMRKLYRKYMHDAEVTYCFAESLMVLNAWQLYEYPSGNPVSDDVEETRAVLEKALATVEHEHHAGLCHLYVHLSEMSAHPELALPACEPLRNLFPHAGHLLHMGTHIDVLVGDYESCVRYNEKAIVADRHVMKCSPATAGRESFYFGYVVHNWHMGIYGAILGGFEAKGMQLARELCELVNEDMFVEYEHLTAYLESYSALDVHLMIRFGRWTQLLEVELPKNKRLMLFRAASIYFARGLAHAALGNVADAKREMDRLNSLRLDPEAKFRILHNNSVADLLAVDAVMLRGEILYREQRYDDAFALLRRAVEMQDDLNYDEPWGKMQPIRHALGGLLLEQGHLEESAEVFRRDLRLHPKNPFALVGLIRCLQRLEQRKGSAGGCCASLDASDEIAKLQQQLEDGKCGWSDFNVVVACECCQRP